jgi:hypothetical protein
MLNTEFIDGVSKEKNFVSLSLIFLKDGTLEDGFLGVTWEIQDGVLVWLHS